MKAFIYFATILFILILIPLGYAIQIGYYSPANSAKIYNIQEYSSIENKDLYSEILIEGSIENKTLTTNLKYSSNFLFSSLEGDKFFPLYILNISVCDGNVGSWSGDYQKIYINCSKQVIFEKNQSKQSINILFNLSNIENNGFFIKIDYIVKDFVIQNGNYDIGWLKTETDPTINVERYLMLPSQNSVIESWSNFAIMTRNEEKKWVLKTNGNGDAMVWYRDYIKEKKRQNNRDILIITITLALSIMIQIYFSQKTTKRTLNLWIFAEAFVLIIGLIYFFDKNEQFSYLLIISFILFCLTSSLAYLSGIKNDRSSYKRELNDIIKFTKNNLLTAICVSSVALIIILIIRNLN